MNYEVLIWPDKGLREETLPVTDFASTAMDMANILSKSMYLYGGIGLAAPQVGIPYQMFVIDGRIFPPDYSYPYATLGAVVFSNPVITYQSEETDTDMEGCLSFPDVFVPVERPLNITVTHMGLSGLTETMEAKGLLARAILHEYDHLNGRLLVDNVGTVKKSMIRRKMLRRKNK